MTTNQGDTSNLWPAPRFYFSVEFEGESPGEGEVASFQEVSGLEVETQAIEYRHSDSHQFSTVKMPGLVKTGNVTLKKGIFLKNSGFYKWYNEIKMNVINRKVVTIRLLDESGAPTMTWQLTNAWPTKISAAGLSSDGNEVAVETVELAHEGLTIANG